MAHKTKNEQCRGALDEDDEFEEFPAEDWQTGSVGDKEEFWEENWEDDNIEQDFTIQVKLELEKKGIFGFNIISVYTPFSVRFRLSVTKIYY